MTIRRTISKAPSCSTAASYGPEQRMVFGANTYRAFAQMLASSTEESDVREPWARMRSLPATVVSTTLEGLNGHVHQVGGMCAQGFVDEFPLVEHVYLITVGQR